MKTPVCEVDGHKVTVVDTRQVSNGAITVHLRCCEDPNTDFTHTMYLLHQKTEDDLKNELAERGAAAADHHKGMIAAQKFIKDVFLSEK